MWPPDRRGSRRPRRWRKGLPVHLGDQFEVRTVVFAGLDKRRSIRTHWPRVGPTVPRPTWPGRSPPAWSKTARRGSRSSCSATASTTPEVKRLGCSRPLGWRGDWTRRSIRRRSAARSRFTTWRSISSRSRSWPSSGRRRRWWHSVRRRGLGAPQAIGGPLSRGPRAGAPAGPFRAQGRAEARFDVQQARPGLYRYDARVEPAPGEVILVNNAESFLLRVVDEPIRVLILEGKPYWDAKFLTRTLARTPRSSSKRGAARRGPVPAPDA